MTRHWTLRSRVVIATLLCMSAGVAVYGQDTADLRDRLRDRYDVLSLQDGVGLVQDRNAGIRIIEKSVTAPCRSTARR
jgi:hypothetical protein